MQTLTEIKVVQPMLLTSIKKSELPSVNPHEYFAFQKYDGFRAIWDKVRFYGRSLEKWDYYFPEMVLALNQYSTCVFDGELINKNGICKAHILQKRLRTNDFHIKMMGGTFSKDIPPTLPATFMIFDILEKDGIDLRNKPIEDRQRILQETLKENEWLQMVKPLEKSFTEAFKSLTEAQREGIVLKKKGSIYVETTSDKRSGYWIKCKMTIEKIIKFNSYEISNAGITLTNDDGFRCACNGHKHTQVKEMIDSSGYAFVEVKGLEQTESGKIRQITYKRLIK